MVNRFSKGRVKTPEKEPLIKSWSYSRWAGWMECPQAFKFKNIDKLGSETEKGPALIRGDQIHKLAENYTLGKIKKLPKELALFSKEFTELKKMKPIVEQTIAFTREWAETRWDDWKGCWLRVKADVQAVDGSEGYIIDHKTGKNRGGYTLQNHLSALALMLKQPHLKKVIAQLWFLDSGEVVEDEYLAKDVGKMRSDWEKRVAPMFLDTKFLPKPGGHCRFCQFAKSKGGPCEMG